MPTTLLYVYMFGVGKPSLTSEPCLLATLFHYYLCCTYYCNACFKINLWFVLLLLSFFLLVAYHMKWIHFMLSFQFINASTLLIWCSSTNCIVIFAIIIMHLIVCQQNNEPTFSIDRSLSGRKIHISSTQRKYGTNKMKLSQRVKCLSIRIQTMIKLD
jgi:hypothetical protein